MNSLKNKSQFPKGIGWIIAALLITFVATLAYWLIYYTSGDVQVRQDEVYLAFENAFPAADTWMAICALLGAIGLLRKRIWGFLFGLLAASSLVYLGLMDVTFDLNQGIYALGGVDTAIEVLINLFCLIVGPLIIIYLWKNRGQWLD
jgi:hypothetical protein